MALLLCPLHILDSREIETVVLSWRLKACAKIVFLLMYTKSQV